MDYDLSSDNGNHGTTFGEYDVWRIGCDVARDSKDLVYPSLGMAGEAGELSEKLEILALGNGLHKHTGREAEHIKKMLRDNDGQLTEEIRKNILLECGDVLWYLSAIAHRAGSNLAEVAKMNIRKLKDRQERGVLKGNGDHR